MLETSSHTDPHRYSVSLTVEACFFWLLLRSTWANSRTIDRAPNTTLQYGTKIEFPSPMTVRAFGCPSGPENWTMNKSNDLCWSRSRVFPHGRILCMCSSLVLFIPVFCLLVCLLQLIHMIWPIRHQNTRDGSSSYKRKKKSMRIVVVVYICVASIHEPDTFRFTYTLAINRNE